MESLNYRVCICSALGDNASFPKWLYQICHLPAIYENASCSSFSPVLGISCLLLWSLGGYHFIIFYFDTNIGVCAKISWSYFKLVSIHDLKQLAFTVSFMQH